MVLFCETTPLIVPFLALFPWAPTIVAYPNHWWSQVTLGHSPACDSSTRLTLPVELWSTATLSEKAAAVLIVWEVTPKPSNDFFLSPRFSPVFSFWLFLFLCIIRVYIPDTITYLVCFVFVSFSFVLVYISLQSWWSGWSVHRIGQVIDFP